MKHPLNHHIRLSLALGLEFQRDNHLQSVSFVIANWIVSLPDLAAAGLAWLFLCFGSLLPLLRSWWIAERRRWAIEWPLIVEATRLFIAGRWLFLELPLQT